VKIRGDRFPDRQCRPVLLVADHRYPYIYILPKIIRKCADFSMNFYSFLGTTTKPAVNAARAAIALLNGTSARPDDVDFYRTISSLGLTQSFEWIVSAGALWSTQLRSATTMRVRLVARERATGTTTLLKQMFFRRSWNDRSDGHDWS